MEQSQLEALAVSAQDAITVATIDVQAQPQVAQALLTSVNKSAGKNVPVAFPLYVVVDSQGSVANVTLGLMSAQSLQQFVLQSLMPAAPTTTPGSEHWYEQYRCAVCRPDQVTLTSNAFVP